MPLLTLSGQSSCAQPKCDLRNNAKSVGIGGRPLRTAGHANAILVVGQSPGYNEDQQNSVFIGKSGAILGWYIKHLPSDADIWATNAVKCLPPIKSDPTIRNVKACAAYLQDDINKLLDVYSDVTILCLGKTAVQAVLGAKTLAAGLSMQGHEVSSLIGKLPLRHPIRAYCTYHPAALMRNPTATMEAAIKDHLALICRHGGRSNLVVTERTAQAFIDEIKQASFDTAAGRGKVLCVDIETYGIRPWSNQTQFHPALSSALDHVPIDRQIVSVAFGLRDLQTNEISTLWGLRSASYDAAVVGVLVATIQAGLPILGTNLLFDLSYLMAALPAFGLSLSRRVFLVDTCVVSFLQNPERPELSLKDLAPLLLDGSHSKYQDKGTRYSDNAALKAYNVKDVVNPLDLLVVLIERMRTAGLPPDPWLTLRHYSGVMHTLYHMTMAGVCTNPQMIGAAYVKWHKRVQRIESQAYDHRGGLIVNGQGSVRSVSSVFDAAVAECPSTIKWELTKKGKISTSKSNMRRVLTIPSVSRNNKRTLRTVKHYRAARKLVSSYLEPLLLTASETPILYPSWFPVPSRFDSGDDSFHEQGGTRQARITCKRPALQTLPGTLKGLLCSRYPRGALLSFDYSQLELRILALVSGDPELINVYTHRNALGQYDGDIHQETLDFVARHHVLKTEPNYERKRRQAKYCNFGVVYGITPDGLKEVWWKYAGIDAPLSEAAAFIHGFKRKYRRVPELHAKLLAQVKRDGVLCLPITGHWLSFADPSLSGALDKAVLNFPIQAYAAIACQIAQGEVIDIMTRNHWGLVPLNIYDALYVDVSDQAYVPFVQRAVIDRMANNWYISELKRYYHVDVPFTVDCKVVSRNYQTTRVLAA